MLFATKNEISGPFTFVLWRLKPMNNLSLFALSLRFITANFLSQNYFHVWAVWGRQPSLRREKRQPFKCFNLRTETEINRWSLNTHFRLNEGNQELNDLVDATELHHQVSFKQNICPSAYEVLNYQLLKVNLKSKPENYREIS